MRHPRLFLGLVLLLLACHVTNAQAQAQRNGWLLFNVLMGAPKESARVGLMKIDGTGKKWVDLGTMVLDPSFAPDGRSLLFSRIDDKAHTADIVTSALDGSSQRVLLNIEGVVLSPVWAPDQKHIAFSVVKREERGHIDGLIIDADGHNLRMIAPGQVVFSPRWSPDGRHLAYVAVDEESRSCKIMVADADGKNPKSVLESKQTMLALAWSPDSRSLAYIEADSKDPHMYSHVHLMDADGGHGRQLTMQPATRLGLEFSNDGKTLFTTELDARAQTSAIVRVAAGGGDVAPLLKSSPGELPLLGGGFVFFLMMRTGPATAPNGPPAEPPQPVAPVPSPKVP